MDTELREILNKVYKQEMRPDEAQWKICALFNVSGSLPLAEMEKRLDEALSKETPETLKKWLEEKRK